MATVQTRTFQEVPPLRRPTDLEIEQAQQALRRLNLATIRDADGTEVELPPLARTLLSQILHELAQGNAVALEPIRPLLTLVQAGAMLGVSEAFVKKLIDDGELTCRIERDWPWIVFEELMAYKKKDDEETSKALDEMVAIAQELGLGY